MKLVRVTDGDYLRYEALLLKRDELEKRAEQIYCAYTRIFGDLIAEVFRLKIECIAFKKAIGYCVRRKNRGERQDPQALAAYIKEKMAGYRAELSEMLRQNEIARKGSRVSAYQEAEIKRIYRRLAKLLHPDLCRMTERHPELADLFQRVMIAYKCNGYKEMKELEVLVMRALENLGGETFNIVITDIEEKIEELEQEIKGIMTTEPYIYLVYLEDMEKQEAKRMTLYDEKKAYSQYKERLQESLKKVQEE